MAALAAVLLILSSAAFSQSAQKPMTEKELSKFIGDWPVVSKWFEDRSQKIASTPGGNLPAALFTGKDFEAFIGKRGWTVDRFSYVSGSAFFLVNLVTIDRQNPDLAQQFDDAIAQIEASDLSADDKAQNIKSMNDAKKLTLGLSGDKEINEAELQLVRAHYKELMALLGNAQGS
jgi:hypothetical protein